MLRLAGPQDLENCKKLLIQFGKTNSVNHQDLYLDDKLNGFTVLVERDDIAIAMSTFTVRRNLCNKKETAILYWENLIVDKHNRDGMAYLLILNYVRKMVKKGEYDDIYFVARRKNALDVHKAAKFKTFGYFSVVVKNIAINKKLAHKSKLICIDYNDFSRAFNSRNQATFNGLSKYTNFKYTPIKMIERWLSGKVGRIIIDEKNKDIYFLRDLFKTRLFELIFFIPGSYSKDKIDLTEFNRAFITITLKIKRHNKKFDGAFRLMPRLVYEGLSLAGKKSLSNFEIWEHDAW